MIIRTAIKGGLFAATVFYIKEAGVWRDSNQSEKLYNDIKTLTAPYVHQLQKNIPVEVPPMPRTGEMRFLLKHYYNQSVKASFHFILMLPCYTGQLIKKAKDGVTQALNTSPN